MSARHKKPGPSPQTPPATSDAGVPATDLSSPALHALSQLVGLQLFSRFFTFALNQLLVRIASPEAFGTATIQFELLLSSILFLAREGVRNALLRSSGSSSGSKGDSNADESRARDTRITNTSLLPIMLGLPLALLTALTYHAVSSPSTRAQPHFSLAISLYALAGILELLAEPLYIRALRELKVGVRVRAEGAAVIAKSIGSVGVLLLLERGLGGTSDFEGKGERRNVEGEWSLVAFAGGQVAYGAAVLGVFLWEYRGQLVWRLVRVKERVHGNVRSTYFDAELLQLSISMTLQSVFKHFLTEGDRFLVSKFSQLKDQGGYAIATNYGSLVARIVFQPIEETSRIFFSKLLSSTKTEASTSTDPASESSASETPSLREQTLTQAANTIHLILLLYLHLSLIFLTFGPPFIPTLLSLLLPARYLSTSAPAVLKAYCLYLPIMALNGFLEAVLSSVASPSDLARQSRFMGLCSVGFVGVAVGLSEGLGWRETGLVYANVVNLGARAAYGWIFLRAWFQRVQSESGSETEIDKGAERDRTSTSKSSSSTPRKIRVEGRKCLPPRSVWLASLLAGCVVRLSAVRYGDVNASIKGKAVHIGVGAASFLGWALVCWISEREMLRGLAGFLRSRRS